jgi:ketosteroid isomerase-like protein
VTNANRAAILTRAVRAAVEGDAEAVPQLYTDDVKAWMPARFAASATELADEIGRRDDSFSDIELEVIPLDVSGDFACAEWSVTMTHTGPIALGGDAILEPTGARITLNGAAVAEFRGDRICALRQYWDELAVLEQLGLIGDEG